jgi:RNA polymerase sigma-70 factor (ECF subfamily)
MDIDHELVSRIKAGHHEAFNALVRRWQKKTYNYAYRYSNDRIFAEEVVQKTFVHVYEKIDQLRDINKFKSWFYRILNNECFSEGRRLKRRKDVFTNSSELPTITDRVNPESIYQKEEKCKYVLMALQQIPEEQRQVIIMKEYEGLKFREIADVLGQSENTIKSRMYYGLDAMKKILLQHQWTKELYHE